MKPEPSSSFPTSVFSESFVLEALEGRITEAPSRDDRIHYPEIVTDSRKITLGCLFVALKGDKFDGHEFVAQAVAQGATGILCEEGTTVPAPARAYRVKGNSQDAFRCLGALWRKQFKIPVIAVAGSVGKTTTKEILSALLRGRWSTLLKTEGSFNGYLGIPMTLLGLRPEHGAAVIEVGIDAIGAMAEHMPLVDPTAAVLTPIGPEHLEFLKDVETVAREETICPRYVDTRSGMTALNLDDPWVRPLATELKAGERIFYSMEGRRGSPGVGRNLLGKLSGDGSRLELALDGAPPFSMDLPLPGKHNAMNLLAASAVGILLGLTPQELQAGLATFKGVEGRSEVRKSRQGNLVLCDYYNASPPSTAAGLELLTHLSPGRVRWACLGDMLELGDGEEKFHRDLCLQIRESKIEHVLLYGPRMKWLLDELNEARNVGKFRGDARHFKTHSELADALEAGLRPEDSVLIKGSRGMKMEEIWKRFGG